MRTVVALVLLCLSGCAAPEPVTLTVWHAWNGMDEELLKGGAAVYRMSQPHVSIAVQRFGSIGELRRAFVKSDQPIPDLILGPSDWTGDLVARGRIAPLDPYLPRSERADFLPIGLDGVSVGGVLYGLPVTLETVALFYNTQLVPKPPATLRELELIARQFTHPQRNEFGLAYDLASPYPNAAWFNGAGATWIDGNGRPSLETVEARAALAIIRRLGGRDGVALPRKLFNDTLIHTLFGIGKIAMIIDGPWAMADLRNYSVPFQVTRLPRIEAEPGSPGPGRWAAPFVGSQALFLNARSFAWREAARFAVALASPELQHDLANRAGRLPSRRSVQVFPDIEADPVLGGFLDQVSIGRPMPNRPELMAVWTPLRYDLLEPVLDGRDVRRAQSRAQARVEEGIRLIHEELETRARERRP